MIDQVKIELSESHQESVEQQRAQAPGKSLFDGTVFSG